MTIGVDLANMMINIAPPYSNQASTEVSEKFSTVDFIPASQAPN